MDEQIREESILNCGEILNIDTEHTKPSSYIKVLGVGGAGTNAVNHMYDKYAIRMRSLWPKVPFQTK